MSKEFYILFCFSWLSLHGVLLGQSDSISIDSIHIISSKIRNPSIGSISNSWETSNLPKVQHSIAELLRSKEGVYIKNYGVGTLATSSIRGGSAGHTAILWNGMPIQSPMLGLLDLSLLPITGIEEVELTKGGNGAAWGSGAIGGVIQMNNRLPIVRGSSWTLKSTLGSFGFHQHTATYRFNKGKLQGKSHISYQRATNNFTYRIGRPKVAKKQQNALSKQLNVLQSLQWTFKKNQKLALHAWHQNAYRQIPPVTTQNISGASQKDVSIRTVLHYSKLLNASELHGKVALFTESMTYVDTILQFTAPNFFWSTAMDAFWKKEITSRHSILLGMSNYYTRATSNGYSVKRQENKLAPYLFWRYSRQKLRTQFSIRQTFVNGKRIPVVPMFGLEWFPFTNWKIHGKISKNYRLPTLNDRYWEPGGNPDLLPESGWSQELSNTFTYEGKKAKFSYRITGFSRRIDDWILWTPDAQKGYWTASNIVKVWSRGLENRLQYLYRMNRNTYKLSVGYDFIRSTNQVALTLPKLSVGQQLLYTPVHQWFMDITYRYNERFSLGYHHQFTGSSKGVNQQLSSYHIGDLSIDYKYRFEDDLTSIFFIKINNLWNEEYRIVERRPMPGRHFQGGIELKF